MVRLAGAWCILAVLLASGCGSERGNAQPRRVVKTSFAEDREEGKAAEVAFDSRRALRYLKEICAIGPRISGTSGMRKQQELLLKHFGNCGAKVRKQTFEARQVSRPRPVEMTNLIFSWHPERARRVILCSHYDTRPIADQEPDPRKWREPFLSANDGGSGVALLMELANHLKDLPTEVGVDFVFFDGEEYIFDRDRDKYFFGSQYFARDYKKGRPRFRYAAAILLDMIGGDRARFPYEGNSALKAGALVEQVWKIAWEQRCPAFQDREGPTVYDDHLALNAAGIPAIDIIDFSYKHWHRLTDLPENCSRDSLDQVARVLAVWLQRAR